MGDSDPVTKLSKNLSSHVDELLWNSSPYQLSLDGKDDHNLVHKAKTRLWNICQDVQLTSSGVGVKETEISEIELSRAAASIAYAIVNSLQADWDVHHFPDKAKVSPNPLNSDGQQREKLAKYFKTPSFGHILEPTMFINMHRRILTWHLPEVLVPDRMTSLFPRELQRKSTLGVHRDSSYFWGGRVWSRMGDFMPRWIYPMPRVRNWLATMTVSEQFWMAITNIISPDQYLAGMKSVSALKGIVHTQKPVVWPSSFSGIEVIVNREMPHHQDLGASPSVYDLLAILDLPDLGAQLGYPPGTMVYIARKVLEHGVPRCGDGERIVIAHFVKDKVHDKQGIPRAGFLMEQDFLIPVGAGRG
ncbi:hypothetical protein BDR04DRAFT_1112556 [Suillus decipiens]|nr:hypothetical protein BDR04DRAFT_1112556 [Suillus decipiens]